MRFDRSFPAKSQLLEPYVLIRFQTDRPTGGADKAVLGRTVTIRTLRGCAFTFVDTREPEALTITAVLPVFRVGKVLT